MFKRDFKAKSFEHILLLNHGCGYTIGMLLLRFLSPHFFCAACKAWSTHRDYVSVSVGIVVVCIVTLWVSGQ